MGEVCPDLTVKFIRDNSDVYFVNIGLGFFVELSKKEIVMKLPEVI